MHCKGRNTLHRSNIHYTGQLHIRQIRHTFTQVSHTLHRPDTQYSGLTHNRSDTYYIGQIHITQTQVRHALHSGSDTQYTGQAHITQVRHTLHSSDTQTEMCDCVL